MQKLAVPIFILILSCTVAMAQTAADLRIPPPPIEFAGWSTGQTSDNIDEFQISFPSPQETTSPENNTVPLTVILPASRSGALPVVVLLHYWGATDLATERSLARRLATAGSASVIVPLPYHLMRTPKGQKSGQAAIVDDPNQLVATMIQAVQDVRRSIDWIQTRPEFDPAKIGICGTSLGAVVASNVFAVDSRVQAYCSILGGANIAELIWKSSRLVAERERLRRKGFTHATLGESLQPIEPTRFLDPSESRPAYLINARYDTVIPTISSAALRTALPNAQRLTLNTGHYGGVFVESSVMKSVTDFFTKTWNGQAFEAPHRLYSPTLRLTGSFASSSGLNIGLGIDIWRLRENSPIFGTVMVTPKSAQIFVGGEVSNGLSLGVVIQSKRTSVGALWSFVL